MATNRQKRTRISNSTQLDESIEEFFRTGTCDRDTPGWALKTSRFFDQGKEIARAWTEHREFLKAKWRKEKRTGTPWAVNKYDNDNENNKLS